MLSPYQSGSSDPECVHLLELFSPLAFAHWSFCFLISCPIQSARKNQESRWNIVYKSLKDFRFQPPIWSSRNFRYQPTDREFQIPTAQSFWNFRYQPLRVSEISDSNHSEFLKFQIPTTQSFWNFRLQPLRVSEISDSNHSEFLKFQIPTTQSFWNFRYQQQKFSKNQWSFWHFRKRVGISDTNQWKFLKFPRLTTETFRCQPSRFQILSVKVTEISEIYCIVPLWFSSWQNGIYKWIP